MCKKFGFFISSQYNNCMHYLNDQIMTNCPTLPKDKNDEISSQKHYKFIHDTHFKINVSVLLSFY